MDVAALRGEFPVLERVAYLNAGTDGPLAAAAVRSAQVELEAALGEGRATPHFERRFELQAQLREGYARVMGCAVEDVALTTSTSEGIGAVMAGMDLGPGDEIVSSDQEHPGVIGPLKAARERGATVRLVPFGELANAVARRPRRSSSARTSAGSPASWRRPSSRRSTCPCCSTARRAPAPCRSTWRRSTAPPTPPPARSGCAGPTAPGCSTSRPRWRERIRPIAPSYISFEDTTRGLESPYKADARRYDTPSLSREAVALSARRARGARAPRLRRRARPRPRAGRRARPPPGRGRPHRRAARRQHARRLGGPGSRGHARPAARGGRRSSATSPAARCCAPRSAPGTTTRTSTACSPRSRPTRAPGAGTARAPRHPAEAS